MNQMHVGLIFSMLLVLTLGSVQHVFSETEQAKTARESNTLEYNHQMLELNNRIFVNQMNHNADLKLQKFIEDTRESNHVIMSKYNIFSQNDSLNIINAKTGTSWIIKNNEQSQRQWYIDKVEDDKKSILKKMIDLHQQRISIVDAEKVKLLNK